MNPLLLQALLTTGQQLIERLFPDKEAQAKQRADAEAQLQQLATQASEQIAQNMLRSDSMQVGVDTVEAQGSSWWRGGWRPAIGWVGALALFCYFVPYCIVATIVWAHQCWSGHMIVPRPDLGIADLIGLITSMLGVGYMRHQERLAGVS